MTWHGVEPPRPGERRTIHHGAIRVDGLPRKYTGHDRIVSHGYVASVSAVGGDICMFFNDLETALVFGRAARMSPDCSAGYGVYRGAREQRDSYGRPPIDVLYVTGPSLDREPGEREHLQRWVDGVTPISSHWHHPDCIAHKVDPSIAKGVPCTCEKVRRRAAGVR